jgi:hypothetical protein
MTISITSPITGGAQTGFTSPTYTHVPDTAPDVNAKQYAVTALGGTQTGVRAHSGTDPFTITYFKPKTFKGLGFADSNGNYQKVAMNRHRLLVRKGVIPATDQPAQVAKIDIMIDIPAGSDVNDAANLRAMTSALVGALSQLSAGLGDTVVTGIM